MPAAHEPDTQRTLPAVEAFRRWTGHEPPEPLTGDELAAFEDRLEQARRDRDRIYGTDTAAA